MYSAHGADVVDHDRGRQVTLGAAAFAAVGQHPIHRRTGKPLRHQA